MQRPRVDRHHRGDRFAATAAAAMRMQKFTDAF
ncbi:hypothetical protein X772_29675 [Mesorhizobium sp. LSJC280B00]|nr:hypothetical protein X772_29675 [Mesorhizobium sp. LSJC280B00]